MAANTGSDKGKPQMYQIKGLVNTETLPAPPDNVLEAHRSSDYDPLINDGKTKTVKLSLNSADRATNVYLAIKGRVSKTTPKGKQPPVAVRKSGADVYVFPSKYVKK